MTFRDFAEEFLRLIESDVAPSTLREYDARLRNSLLPTFGGRWLSQITPKQIEEWKGQRAKHVSPARINDELILLKRIFHKAQEWGATKNDPFRGVRKIKEPEHEPRFLTQEEVARLLATAPSEWRVAIAIGVYAGLRASELVNLEWSDINVQRGTLTVQNKTGEGGWITKSTRNRTIPIAPALLPYLTHHPRHFRSSYVFCNKAGDRRDPHLDTLQSIGKHAGIPGLTPHVLRHSFASHLVMAGVDLVTVKELLGHTDIATTMRYAHLAPDHKRLAITKLDFSHPMDTSLQQEAVK
ncbi:MAG: site-specific integrase [Candidatus Latescibacteria bacterium]|nr:site-specific integrase [Candidatus Latescibacterota bacterium]